MFLYLASRLVLLLSFAQVQAYDLVLERMGWIREMHSFVLAAADMQLDGKSAPMNVTYHSDFMVQTSS